jgi:hypothetical protein
VVIGIDAARDPERSMTVDLGATPWGIMVRMSEVEVLSIEGRRLKFHQALGGSGDSMWSFTADLEGETFRASVSVWDLGDGLATYFSNLAAQWAGFDGEIAYASLEGTLALSGRHDGKGTVTMSVTLRQPWPPTWTVVANLHLGAGAHLDSIAADVLQLVEEALGD